MKKFLKKIGTGKLVGGCLGILGLIMAIAAAFLGKFEDTQLIIQIIACLLILVGLFILALKAEKNRGLKALGAVTLSAIIFSWILPTGGFNGATFVLSEDVLSRIGFADIGAGLYYAFNFTLDKLLFLFVLCLFYGILSKVRGYQKLVHNLARALKKYEIVTALVMSLIIMAATAMVRDAFVVLIFVPFFVSILKNMKVEKLTTFAITYGSIVVGLMGALYGSQSLIDFNYYINAEVTTGLLYRGIVLAIAYVLYNFFIVMRLRKLAKVKNPELVEDPFEVESTRKPTYAWPTALILGLLFVVTIIAYIAWSANWDIAFFTDIHEKVLGFNIGKLPLFQYLLGNNVFALGEIEYLFGLDTLLIITALLLSLIYRLKLDDVIESAIEGIKKAAKPVAIVVAVYFVFFLIYMSPFIPALTNWVYGLTNNTLNPILASIIAFISSLFSADFGFTAYSIGQFLTAAFTTDFEIVHAIYTTMYGLVQVCMPTSAVLMVGLALMKVDYKSWLKYIWLFAVGMFVILIVLFSVVLYI